MPVMAPFPWACSSVVEHCVDIAGVASSILATPTTKNPANPMGWWGFYLSGGGDLADRVRCNSGVLLKRTRNKSCLRCGIRAEFKRCRGGVRNPLRRWGMHAVRLRREIRRARARTARRSTCLISSRTCSRITAPSHQCRNDNWSAYRQVFNHLTDRAAEAPDAEIGVAEPASVTPCNLDGLCKRDSV